MKNLILFGLIFALLSQASFAATRSFAELVHNYRYAVIVEWDQADPAFLQTAEKEFQQGIVKLLEDGASPQDLLEESLLLIPNATLKRELTEGVGHYQSGNFSEKELLDFVLQNISSMESQGSSWSPVAKVALGIIGGYAIFKILMLTILYWDTDPNYGQPGDPPPIPKSI